METKTCTDCGAEFKMTEKERDLYEKIKLAPPGICFYCRFRQHCAFWIFGKFRKGVSALSGDSIITVIPENVRFPIYTYAEWWSDKWTAMDYGQDYDPSRPFFDQLKELQEKIPRPHQMGNLNTNCEWCDDSWESKNCYLGRAVLRSEEVSYGYRVIDTKNSVDVTYCFIMDKSYDCLFCFNSYNLNYSRNSRNCIDSYFFFFFRSCTDCFMCWNVSNKSYCILNEQYTKEEYFKKIKEYDLGSHEQIESLKKDFEGIMQKSAVHRATYNISSETPKGNYLTNCEKCINCFQIEDSENVFNSVRGLKQETCIDMAGNWMIEASGNLSCCTECFDIRYSIWCEKVRYSEYCDLCYESEYIFGCVGVRKKKFCILNKQYTEEEYNKLREQIISDMKARGEYGKFPPYNMGLGSYNLTVGMMYLPNTNKEMIEKVGGYWEDIVEDVVDGLETKDLPDNIKDVTDDITTQALVCPMTGWRYNIAQHELEFYRQKNIPLPRVHFDVRTKERVKYLTVIEPFSATCMYCHKEVTTYYRPEWGYKNIACEECYLKEIM